MLNPSRAEARNFFFTAYNKGNAQQALTALEKITYGVIVEHPEYSHILANPDKYRDFTWSPTTGETNPFLHLSLHVSILEQLSINQPPGITPLYQELCATLANEHEAQHQVMDCLAEMIWQSQFTQMQPDPTIYLSCLRQKLGKE